MTVKALYKARIFDSMDRGEIDSVINGAGCRFREYERDTPIICEGEKVEYIGVVTEGSVVTEKVDRRGSANLIMKLMPGEQFSADVCFSRSDVCSYWVRAATDAKVCYIPYSALISEKLPVELRCRLMQNLLGILSNENMRRMYKIEILSQYSLRERVMLYLRLMRGQKGSDEFTIPFDREQLAQYLNVNRSALSHELSKMRDEGLIDFRKNKFRIKAV